MTKENEYRVLARKYRPKTFEDLIGQESLVQTLENAIKTNRLAQAYILTGIRGIGKTTSARIIARALNCIGADGQGQMTTSPCGVCEHCVAIEQDRHVDVVEIDAASNNGVANVRELIETTRYNPTSARFKVYIIDEVHMLSTQAFNALLKTLEEPPSRVKFIFATTEIRKVPTTVLSRCQRFDLRRTEPELLTTHFKNIIKKENVEAEEEALRLIARAADGSVRDGLSLLDQAIAHGGGLVTAQFVHTMIGLADRVAVVDLFELIMKGDIKGALSAFSEQYNLGANPLVVLQDLLELTHWITRVKIAPKLKEDASLGKNERDRCAEMAQSLSMAILTRTWQILLKGVQEVSSSSLGKQAAEMVLIRLAYAADLPTPFEIISELKSSQQNDSGSLATRQSAPIRSSETSALSDMRNLTPWQATFSQTTSETSATSSTTSDFSTPSPISTGVCDWNGIKPLSNTAPLLHSEIKQGVLFKSLADVVAYAYKQNEMMFAYHLENAVSLVSFEVGKIEFFPLEKAPRTLAGELAEKLQLWTKNRWIVSVSTKQGGKTLRQEADENKENLKNMLLQKPIVSKTLVLFPKAKIESIRLRKEQELDQEEDVYLDE